MSYRSKIEESINNQDFNPVVIKQIKKHDLSAIKASHLINSPQKEKQKFKTQQSQNNNQISDE